MSHTINLSESELNELEAKYFDEVKFAQWAVDELKAARARGDSVTLSELLSNAPKKPPTPKRKPQTHRKRRELEEGEPIQASTDIAAV